MAKKLFEGLTRLTPTAPAAPTTAHESADHAGTHTEPPAHAQATPASTIGQQHGGTTLQLEADKPQGPANMVHVTSSAVVATEDLAGMGFDPNDNMTGVEPRLPQIKILSQAQMFELPGGETVKRFSGIIIDSRRANAYWSKSMSESGAGNAPDCFSFDGVRPHGENPISKVCAACPMNKYGSEPGKNGENGLGKACKNMRRIHVLLDGNILPFRLTLPPTSLKPHDAYMVDLSNRRRPYPTVVTEISLAKAKNKGGIEYGQVQMAMAGEINDRDTLIEIRNLRDKLAETMATQEVTADEYGASENGHGAGAAACNQDEHPFG